MLFFPHQEPPPKPPAAVQVVQKAQDDAAGHGSLVGPPKSLMTGAKLDFRKFDRLLYFEVVVIEGEAETVDKRLATNQLALPSMRFIWSRHGQLDLRLAKMAPFWMTNVYGLGHNGIRGGYYPIGWGY